MQDIIKKLKFTEKSFILNAPANIEKEFIELGFTTFFDKKIKSTNTLVFINNNEEFVNFLDKRSSKIISKKSR